MSGDQSHLVHLTIIAFVFDSNLSCLPKGESVFTVKTVGEIME